MGRVLLPQFSHVLSKSVNPTRARACVLSKAVRLRGIQGGGKTNTFALLALTSPPPPAPLFLFSLPRSSSAGEITQLTTLAKFSAFDAPRRQSDGGEKSQYDPEYHVQMSRVVETLLEELPRIIEEGLSYDIYSNSMDLFVGKRIISGLSGYKLAVRSFRIVSRLFLSSRGRSLNVWRVQPNEKDTVILRWCLKGHVRGCGELEIEGTSFYELNRKGFVDRHYIEFVARNGISKFLASLLSPTPEPCPQC